MEGRHLYFDESSTSNLKRGHSFSNEISVFLNVGDVSVDLMISVAEFSNVIDFENALKIYLISFLRIQQSVSYTHLTLPTTERV